MALTKAELADILFEKVGLNKREAKDMVEAFFEEIRAQLGRGENVRLSDPALVTFRFETSLNARVVIQRLARTYPSLRGAW